MNARIKTYPLNHLVVLTADGKLDLAASKAAISLVGAAPDFDNRMEVVLDFRKVECAMSLGEIYKLAEHMAYPDPALQTSQKIAVLVEGNSEFDHAQFLEVCANNRGLVVRAFQDITRANAWLNAELPGELRETT